MTSYCSFLNSSSSRVLQNGIRHSESGFGPEESLFSWDLERREILRFAQNDDRQLFQHPVSGGFSDLS
jgi:hypothetical protein